LGLLGWFIVASGASWAVVASIDDRMGLALERGKPRFYERVDMLNSVLEILSSLGVLPAIQFMAVAASAIFVYRYFTDRG
jgi:hypothetical protein